MRFGLRLVAVTASALLFTARAHAEPAPACGVPVTTCEGSDGYYASYEDRERLQSSLEPLLKDLRSCLDNAGGAKITPAVSIRFDSDGQPVTQRIEAPGFESHPCVTAATAKLAKMRVARETAMRCERGCPKPKPLPAPLTQPAPVSASPPPPTEQTAPAAPASYRAPLPARYEKVWYGWGNLAADGLSVGLLALGISTKSTTLNVAGVLTYIVGSPAVHWAHTKVGVGFASLGMRVLVPLVSAGVGALVGVFIDNRNSLSGGTSSAETGAVVGLVASALVVSAIDAAALAYEKVEVEPAEARARKTPAARRFLSVMPTFDLHGDSATVGAQGTF